MNKPYLYIARAWASRYHGHVTSPTSEHVSVRHVTRVFSIFGGGGGGGGPFFPGIPRCLTAGAWWLTQLHTAVSGGYYLFIGGDGDGLARSLQWLLFPFLSAQADSWLLSMTWLSRLGAHAPHLPHGRQEFCAPFVNLV